MVFYRDCPCRSSICSRVAICCVGLAARNFGNGRVVLCTWETIIASSGLQLLWEGYGVFFLFFVCILYNIIIIQYNLILWIAGVHSCFIICTLFALIWPKSGGIVAKCPISLKMTPLKGRGCISPSFWPLALNISFCLRTPRLSIKNLPA